MWPKALLVLFALAGPAPAVDLVIRNVTIIDVNTGAELPKRSVLIHGKQISAVGFAVKPPKGARIINGTGKFLIPGLWDMRVHLRNRENQFPLFLANGVTGLRDMGSDLNWVNQWRDQIKAGKLLGPHLEASGPAVDGTASQDEKLPVFVVRGPNDARSVFDRLDQLQVDFIQVLPGVPRDAYFALVERARKYYVPVAGHVPDSVSLMEAIDARQKSVEHMSGLLLACSKHEDRLRKRRMLALEKKDWNAYGDIQAEALDTFDPEKARAVMERMAQFDVREVPALTTLRRSISDADADRKRLATAVYEKNRELLPQMKRAGVMIMAGTDTGYPHSSPGYDLHRELELLVDAGLTPLDALRCATLEPAKYFDATDNVGSIEPGRDADLVLLDADPLKDICNTRKIAGVLIAGTYLPRTHLNAMLVAARKR